jgi:hypothetical protein
MRSRQARWAAGSVREQVNQRIYELSAEHPSPFATEYLCECGAASCPAFVTLTLPEYEHLRTARQPILASGHSRA